MASYILLSLFTFLLLPFSSLSTDPSPLQDFCIADLSSPLYFNGFPCKNPATVTSDDFFYDGLKQEPDHYEPFGFNATLGSVRQFPGINTLGLSMNKVTILEGALTPPHVHPRATELAVLVKGKLLIGLISTSNVLYSKVVSPGTTFVFPPGLVHFQLNVGKGSAYFYSTFNSQNPGIQFVGNALFNSTPSVVDEVLSKAFRVNASTVDLIKSHFKGA